MVTLIAIGLAVWAVWRLGFFLEDVLINGVKPGKDYTGQKYLILAVSVFIAFWFFFRSKIRYK